MKTFNYDINLIIQFKLTNRSALLSIVASLVQTMLSPICWKWNYNHFNWIIWIKWIHISWHFYSSHMSCHKIFLRDFLKWIAVFVWNEALTETAKSNVLGTFAFNEYVPSYLGMKCDFIVVLLLQHIRYTGFVGK